MSRLNIAPEQKLDEVTAGNLDPFRLKGQIAEVYLQIANSEPALNAYLAMETALKASSLSLSEIEAIKLLVSELNQCEYCLSVHHMKATAAGLDDKTKMAIRAGHPTGDNRIDLLVSTVRGFFVKPGPVSDEMLTRLKAAGFSDGELVDLSLVAATIFFTNIFNHLNNTISTLPAAPNLDVAK